MALSLLKAGGQRRLESPRETGQFGVQPGEAGIQARGSWFPDI